MFSQVGLPSADLNQAAQINMFFLPKRTRGVCQQRPVPAYQAGTSRAKRFFCVADCLVKVQTLTARYRCLCCHTQIFGVEDLASAPELSAPE